MWAEESTARGSAVMDDDRETVRIAIFVNAKVPAVVGLHVEHGSLIVGLARGTASQHVPASLSPDWN
jgi:hypothetical protein